MPRSGYPGVFVLDSRSGSIGSKGATIDISVTRLENDAGTLIAERGLKMWRPMRRTVQGAYRRQW